MSLFTDLSIPSEPQILPATTQHQSSSSAFADKAESNNKHYDENELVPPEPEQQVTIVPGPKQTTNASSGANQTSQNQPLPQKQALQRGALEVTLLPALEKVVLRPSQTFRFNFSSKISMLFTTNLKSGLSMRCCVGL